MRVLAVSAGAPADTRAFAAQRFGNAPVVVYLDASHVIDKAFRVVSHPEFRFVTSAGKLTSRRPSGFPFR